MTQDTKLQQLVINKLTTAQYNSAVEAGTIDPNQLYMTTDSVTISDIKVNGVSVVDGEEADITLGTMATETTSDYSKKSVADTLYAAKSLESTVSTHIANKTNPHQVTKAQVGLGNVDNTSDLNKPISTLTQAALNNKVDKVSTANKIYGTDSSGVQTTYDKSSFGNVDDVKVGTTSVVANKIAVLGTMAGENTGNYYKKTDLASVATSGSWADLTNTPTTIGGYGITDAYTKSEIDGKLSAGMHYKGTVASYSNLPTTGQVIGDLYNVTDTGANYAWNGTTWDKMSENVDLSNFYTKTEIDGFLEDKADSEDIPTATSQLTNDSGYITSITSSDVTTALGYTPYNSTNPNGYITSSAIEGFIRNTATGTNSLTILGNATSQNQAVNIGASSSVTGTQGVAIGYNASTITSVAIGASASANYTHALAIGNGATVSAAGGIQIGQGTTSDASLNVALGGTTHTNYKLLGSDGKIPDDRLNTTIARTSQIPTTVAELSDATDYVKKDGGSSEQTIRLSSGTGTTALGVKSMSSSSYISFSGASKWLGSYGVTTNKEPTFYNGTSHTLAYTEDIPTTVAELTDASNYALVSSLAIVATSGDYDDLVNKPSWTYDSTTETLTLS